MILCISLLLIVTGCSEPISQNWLLSPTFKIPVTFGDGTKGEYVLVGEEGKVGFQIGSGKEGEAIPQPIIKEKPNKYMWYFWGETKEIEGEWKIVGINEKGKEQNDFIIKPATIPPFSNTETHTKIPTQMVFPTAGLWKLEVFISNKLYGEIVLNVED
jgi:hypothetical protein